MKLKIVQAGDPILRRQSRPLLKEEISSPSIQQLIELMREAMREAPGVGLAAPQIGESIQLAVIEDRPAYIANLSAE
ncbi:MAG TPA: peptide deformylase, partial [Pyrinomonadaceae bacterium]|nr:peptide deformylase [Pyrinomonadaceae bacterium]